jgi:hypothetical protein
VTEYSDVPEDVVAPLRSVCMALPEVEEHQAWAGRRWSVRRKTFAHVLTVEGPGQPTTVLTFRSSGAELGVLHSAGHPFFRPGWGSNTVGMVLDHDTDWDEVAELMTESYCVQAPKKLVTLVERPAEQP